MVKWKRRGRSGDLIDRRGSPGRAGGIPIRVGTLGRLGVPGLIVIAIIVVVNVLGGTGLDGGVGSVQPSDGEPAASPLDPARDPDAELVDFLSFVSLWLQSADLGDGLMTV